MKKRILFVDDEPWILEGLQNLLRRQRHKWDMTFVLSGEEALRELEEAPFDVIVSDMRMPEMDGASLLKRVQDHHPDVVRIVLSGHAEFKTAVRAVPVAHQFLTKPCEPDLIENTIERACRLRTLINDRTLRNTVGKIEKLPSRPRVYSELMAVLANEDVSMADVARILERDMAMCAKMLQMVNSSFFRLSRRITNIEEAVAYLGFNTIKHLALAAEVFKNGSDRPKPRGLSIERLQDHGMLTANIASRLATSKEEREDALIAGLLHDIGKLVMAMELPDLFGKVITAMQTQAGSMHAVEEDLSGFTHAEVGGYLLGLWGLPYRIVEAVANHHQPDRVEQRSFDILSAVHIADILANEQLPPVMEIAEQGVLAANTTHLEALGVTARLEGWREMAAAQARAFSSDATTEP